MAKLHFMKWNRKIHYWGAALCALPVLLVIFTGILLLLKKQSHWIQPPTMRGGGGTPQLTWHEIYQAAASTPELGVSCWLDIDRIDARLEKGVVKVIAKNGWELQLDQADGRVLLVAYRRSDLIEALHDGSFFHENVKLMIFLPSALVLLMLWVTGIYLFIKPLTSKIARRKSARIQQ